MCLFSLFYCPGSAAVKQFVHNSKEDNFGIHSMLVDMKGPDFPVALGVIRDVEDKTYDDSIYEQMEEVKAKAKIHSMDELLHSGATWTVE